MMFISAKNMGELDGANVSALVCVYRTFYKY